MQEGTGDLIAAAIMIGITIAAICAYDRWGRWL